MSWCKLSNVATITLINPNHRSVVVTCSNRHVVKLDITKFYRVPRDGIQHYMTVLILA